jgi:hypothetical protein
MDDEDRLLRDDDFRDNALSKSMALFGKWFDRGDVTATLEHQVEDIISVANTFYTFLKGETK